MEPYRFQVLGSSSSGNCALLSTGESRVLIDAGLSGRRIRTLLAEAGESIDGIDAIFITHEHQDHCGGLFGLARHAGIPVYANSHTARAIQPRLKHKPSWRLFETGTRFTFRDLEVEAFTVPHDAHDPVAFTFKWGGDDLFSPRRSLAWVTDLGSVPQLVREKIREVDVLAIESNYDEGLLERDIKRPWSIKQRIRGRHGHLSNEAVVELVGEMGDTAWRQLVLLHLSRECNNISVVQDSLRPLNGSRRRAFEVEVVDPIGGLGKAIGF
ncbi:MAG: MBL fold metallo-hydrolase [Verrucomicrobiota bacterium]